MKTFLTPVLLVLLVALSCKDNGDVLLETATTPVHPPVAIDTVRFEFRLDGLRESYDLDDTVSGALIAINKSSARPLHLSAGGFPPEYWSLRRFGHEDLDYFYPLLIETTEYIDSLVLGDTLMFKITWAQDAYVPNVLNRAYSQKAFAGTYELRAHFPWTDLFGDIALSRTLTIREHGEALSGVLVVGSPLYDTVDCSLAVRNRVSTMAEYAIDDSLPVRVSFSTGADTVLKRSYPLPYRVLSLQPFSDTIPFRFRRAARDTIFSGMRGTYKMSVSLLLRDREISASSTVWIFP